MALLYRFIAAIGWITRHMAHLVEVDEFSAAYLRARADAIHKTPAEIIGEMVRKQMSAAI